MSHRFDQNCERFEAMIAEWFDGTLPADAREALTAHVTSCASCRESFELSSQLEEGLVSRRSLVPAVDAFLPGIAPAPSQVAHPRLVSVFRAIMSPAGIAAVLVMWIAMVTLRFREPIGAWLGTAGKGVGVFSNNVLNGLLEVSRGDTMILTGIYIALALVLLASTGAITLRYIRNS